MDDCPELVLKQICCTCLSQDRKLTQLCRLTEGINNLYLLLSYDSEAYREGFYKDTAHWFICWECWAVMRRFSKFRIQACAAQRQLADILDGRTDIKLFKVCLSRLRKSHTTSYDQTITSEPDTTDTDNFIDCGDIKEDSDEDTPLSELNKMAERHSDDNTIDKEGYKEKCLDIRPVYNKRKKINPQRKKFRLNAEGNKDQFSTSNMNEETRECRERRKMKGYTDAELKCEPCVVVFKSQIDLDKHNTDFHSEGFPKNVRVKNPGSKPRRNVAMMDKKTEFGYKCAECDKYFDNKNLRWKHVQRTHREGYKCLVCGKRFAFKNNLSRHELSHKGPPPRSECPHCLKQVRDDLLKVHLRIHTARQAYQCAECNKKFASKASYEHHLKYTQRHANTPPNKYKCTMCDKAYRSRGELRDHTNYQHMGKTKHKCPVCGKALATPRCVTRHVRRAHDGLREQVRDKVCQQCGKTFRDKKTLREHEFIHTGERPLSCEICGCTFRQSASLYTHRKRVHKIYPPQRQVQLIIEEQKEP